MILKNGFVIAIDGPAASGKGTISPLLAKKLHGHYIDTGIFFRCIALYCLQKNIDISDAWKVSSILSQIHIGFSESQRVTLNGKDVTTDIRSVQVSAGSSKVAVIDEVLHKMVLFFQEMCSNYLKNGKTVVIEGRNMGSAVVPDANIKIFLTADLLTRAKRRMKQWQAKGIRNISLEKIIQDTQERDKRDSERETFPLVKNPKEMGYFILDNSKLSEEETMEKIIAEIKRRKLI